MTSRTSLPMLRTYCTVICWKLTLGSWLKVLCLTGPMSGHQRWGMISHKWCGINIWNSMKDLKKLCSIANITSSLTWLTPSPQPTLSQTLPLLKPLAIPQIIPSVICLLCSVLACHSFRFHSARTCSVVCAPCLYPCCKDPASATTAHKCSVHLPLFHICTLLFAVIFFILFYSWITQSIVTLASGSMSIWNMIQEHYKKKKTMHKFSRRGEQECLQLFWLAQWHAFTKL